MVGWMLDKVKDLVRNFLKDLLFSVAKRVLLEEALKALLVSAGRYQKRLDVVILFEKRKVLFGLEGEELTVYEPQAEGVAAVSLDAQEYVALWAMTSHLPKKRTRVKEKGWWEVLRLVWRLLGVACGMLLRLAELELKHEEGDRKLVVGVHLGLREV